MRLSQRWSTEEVEKIFAQAPGDHLYYKAYYLLEAYAGSSEDGALGMAKAVWARCKEGHWFVNYADEVRLALAESKARLAGNKETFEHQCEQAVAEKQRRDILLQEQEENAPRKLFKFFSKASRSDTEFNKDESLNQELDRILQCELYILLAAICTKVNLSGKRHNSSGTLTKIFCVIIENSSDELMKDSFQALFEGHSDWQSLGETLSNFVEVSTERIMSKVETIKKVLTFM